jgi:hypothetical protein
LSEDVMAKKASHRRSARGGASKRGTPLVEPGEGPRAFYVKVKTLRHLLCDPDAPLVPGCEVVIVFDEGGAIHGTLETKHPKRAKELAVRAYDWGAGRTRVLRGIKRSEVARVVAESHEL